MKSRERSQETLVRENHRNLGPIRKRVMKRNQGWPQSVQFGGCGVRMLETFPQKGTENKEGGRQQVQTWTRGI